jgi:hypothetical protein
VELVFLSTSRVVELLFFSARSGGGWFSPSLFGLWWLVICLLFVISFILAGLFISRCLLWRSGRANVSAARWFLALFFCFSFTFFFDFESQIYTNLWCAWGPRSAFFRPCSAATCYTASDLRLCGLGDGECPSRVTVRHLGLFPPLSATCFGCFLPVCFLCFYLVSPVSACLCLNQILWEYLLANC